MQEQTLNSCPECGSSELRETTRVLASGTEIPVTVCGVCHWTSDPRVGRPPADRGKNITLRRLVRDVEGASQREPGT